MIDRQVECVPCPDSIAVIGGGRWARVLTRVLCDIVPASVRISVHSLRHADSMSAWAVSQGLERRIQVSSEWEWPKPPVKSRAVIVANAARDHEKAVEWALSAGASVLVEKPMTLTAADSQRLADLARSRGAHLAAAHVFLFARYLDRFSSLVAGAQGIRHLDVRWTDPVSENRHGEIKRYDASLPVFADWLPHVLSMLGALTPHEAHQEEITRFSRGGAHLGLRLRFGDIPCDIELTRDGDQRRRMITVTTEGKTFQLDFSREPGVITDGSTSMIGDPDWETRPRPVARMLTAFLEWAGGGEPDGRLNVEIGLRASQVIDRIWSPYRPMQASWLADKLSIAGPVDDDLRYALNEREVL